MDELASLRRALAAEEELCHGCETHGLIRIVRQLRIHVHTMNMKRCIKTDTPLIFDPEHEIVTPKNMILIPMKVNATVVIHEDISSQGWGPQIDIGAIEYTLGPERFRFEHALSPALVVRAEFDVSLLLEAYVADHVERMRDTTTEARTTLSAVSWTMH
jgi:hypothetical protein